MLSWVDLINNQQLIQDSCVFHWIQVAGMKMCFGFGSVSRNESGNSLAVLWSHTDPLVLIDSHRRLENTWLAFPSSPRWNNTCMHWNYAHTKHRWTLHGHTCAHNSAVTDFFVHYYDLTPINHKLERLSVNVIRTAGAGTVGRLNVYESVRTGVWTLLYSCWRSCCCYELWPWPSLAQRWVGTWTHAGALELTHTCFTPMFPAQSHAAFVKFWVDIQIPLH